MKKILLSTIVASSVLLASSYKYEVSPMVGYIDTKDHVDIKDQSAVGVSVAKNMDKNCKFDQLEVGLLQTIKKYDYETIAQDSSLSRLFLNGIKEYTIDNKLKFYGLVGLGYEYISNQQLQNDSGVFFNYGAGVKYALNETLSLKFDIRHLLKFDGDKDVVYTLGVSIPFSKIEQPKPKVESKIELDSDHDGVLDKNDNCPATPIGRMVDKKGCEFDTDHDGILDGDDNCPNSSLNAKVGVTGCEILAKIDKDSDGDGVLDSKDLCPNTLDGIQVDKNGCKIFNKPESLNVLFKTNSAKIEGIDSDKFIKYVKYMDQFPSATLILEGYTDDIGTKVYNLKLSQRRANSVKAKLVGLGIDPKRIKTIGYGESKPVVPNDTAEHRQLNRRVTAKLIK